MGSPVRRGEKRAPYCSICLGVSAADRRVRPSAVPRALSGPAAASISPRSRFVDVLALRCAARSVQTLPLDAQYLGAEPGRVGVLHTGTRDLRDHPHVRCLVIAGARIKDRLKADPKVREWAAATMQEPRIYR